VAQLPTNDACWVTTDGQMVDGGGGGGAVSLGWSSMGAVDLVSSADDLASPLPAISFPTPRPLPTSPLVLCTLG
jgi:hypothetical protein